MLAQVSSIRSTLLWRFCQAPSANLTWSKGTAAEGAGSGRVSQCEIFVLWDVGSSSPRVGGDDVGADLPPPSLGPVVAPLGLPRPQARTTFPW